MISEAPIEACCTAVYGNPVTELLVGEWLHPGGPAATRSLLRAAGLSAGARLLDVGCGLGASARLAASEFGLRVEAIDTNVATIERARARTPDRWPVNLKVGSVSRLPEPDESFDAVLAECVLSTVPKARALAEIARVIRPGGWLLLSDVTRSSGDVPVWAAQPVLAAALCLDGAWLPDELEAMPPTHGFAIKRRIDQRAALLELVDRVEARARLLAAVGRDLGGLLSPNALAMLGVTSMTLDDGLAALAAVRQAVKERRLGYVSLVARKQFGPA